VTTAPPPPAAAVPPPRFRLLLDDAMRLLRVHFRTIFVPVALPLALVSGTFPLMQLAFMGSMTRSPEPTPGAIGFMVLFGVVVLAWLLLYLLGYTAMMVAAVDAVAGRPVSMARAFRIAIRPRVIFTMILSWLAIVIGAMCCCLPGVYVALLMSVLVPVVVEEDDWGPDAMSRSARLVSHNPTRELAADPRLRALVIIVAGALLSYGLSMIVQFPFLVAQQVILFRSVGEGRAPDPLSVMSATMWLQVPAQVGGTLAQMVIQLYMALALALFYFDLRRRKEGEDLQSAIDRMSGVPPAAPA
jgi:hypothetical protein